MIIYTDTSIKLKKSDNRKLLSSTYKKKKLQVKKYVFWLDPHYLANFQLM